MVSPDSGEDDRRSQDYEEAKPRFLSLKQFRLASVTPRLRLYIVIAALLGCLTVLFFYQAPWAYRPRQYDLNNVPRPPPRPPVFKNPGIWECEDAFGPLFQEIDRAKEYHLKRKPKGLSESDIDQYDGRAQLRLLIYDGELRILDAWGIEGPRHSPDRPLATLSAIHRALAAVREPSSIPSIEFTIETTDDSRGGGRNHTIWGYCRKKDDYGQWVMPDFGFWSYPHSTVGSYDGFRTRVNETEEAGGFRQKLPKLVWRGNSREEQANNVRTKLYQASHDKDWADVEYTDKIDQRMDMHEHCRYMFAAHTEGITWSGRLRYLQNCNNVVITHKLDWMAHYYPLLTSSGENQNIIEVRRDFSDLLKAMEHFLSRPAEAERIAKNAAYFLRDRYLTPAAESCYWRRMFRSWSEIQGFKPRIWTDGKSKGEEGRRRWRGMAWEEYLATGKKWGEDAPL